MEHNTITEEQRAWYRGAVAKYVDAGWWVPISEGTQNDRLLPAADVFSVHPERHRGADDRHARLGFTLERARHVRGISAQAILYAQCIQLCGCTVCPNITYTRTIPPMMMSMFD